MSFTTGRIGFGLLFALNSLVALGQTPPTNELRETRQEVEQLKQEYDQMKQAYEERFKKLDERLKQLETANSGPTGVAYAAAVSAPKPATKVTVVATTPAAAGQEASGAEAQAGEAPVQFQEPTDSMQLSLAEQENNRVRERMERVMREYVDITGYFRAGYGRDNDGGPQVGFQAPGALAKGRLGNEAENYGEIAIGKNFYLPEAFSLNRSPRPDGTSSQPVARVLVRISMFNPYQNYGVSSGTSFGIAEAWAAIGNLSSSQPSMNVWAGNRYYRRHDIHIDDFMMYNMSGGGGGVEDIKLPIGKLAFAWIGQGSQSGFSDLPQPDPANKAGFNKSNFDFRWYDVKFLGGARRVRLRYIARHLGPRSVRRVGSRCHGRVVYVYPHEREVGGERKQPEQVLPSIWPRARQNIHIRIRDLQHGCRDFHPAGRAGIVSLPRS